MPWETFWTEPSGTVELGLRRYVSTSSGKTCPLTDGYHNAVVPIGCQPERRTADGFLEVWPVAEFEGDPRWPTSCPCGYVFEADDTWQVFQEAVYRRPDTGETWPQRELPTGAMYDASWLPDDWKGPDGIGLVVILPGGHPWHVDMEASNCTRKGDRTHKCWVRHGDPRTEPVHVDKDGETCAAGAGSIAAPGYHGFLHHGVLTDG